MEKDKRVEIQRKENVITQVYMPYNYPKPIAIDCKPYQPERSKREDYQRCDGCKKICPSSHMCAFVDRCGALNTMET